MLLEKLTAYGCSDSYPFHMPGHKRALTLPADAYRLDITEIDGFDNLHHAQDILKEEQECYAEMVGAKQTFFLVNGSTCGILAAICSVSGRGGRLLVARNSHKAAYHALYLWQLRAAYVYPSISRYDIQGAIDPQEIARQLQADPSIAAVYITSPTYDGVVSDIARIAQIVHSHGKVLIVDEAHGAHFGFHPAFPQSAVRLGADLVIQSVHKTLPAFTQSAVLHLCSDRVDAAEVARFLAIYESSSPSYVLMAGISRLNDYMKSEGIARLEQLHGQLEQFYACAGQYRHLHVIGAADFEPSSAFAHDPSKILISTAACSISGRELYERLVRDYRLQPEMYSGEYVTMLCSLMDEPVGFTRLMAALEEIDGVIGEAEKPAKGFVRRMYSRRIAVCPVAQAIDVPQECVAVAKAAGRISAEYIYLYPPGIPLLVPGEMISQQLVSDLDELKRYGMLPEGLQDASAQHIRVLTY